MAEPLSRLTIQRRAKNAERLTNEVLKLIANIAAIRGLTEEQAWKMKEAIETAAREMHFQIKVANERVPKFSLKDRTAAPEGEHG